jgi:hypothetical protein
MVGRRFSLALGRMTVSPQQPPERLATDLDAFATRKDFPQMGIIEPAVLGLDQLEDPLA